MAKAKGKKSKGSSKKKPKPVEAAVDLPRTTEIYTIGPGQVLETNDIAVRAMRKSETITISCSCSKATPDRPRCERTVTTTPDSVRVTCSPVGGCQSCSRRVDIPSIGLLFETEGRPEPVDSDDRPPVAVMTIA